MEEKTPVINKKILYGITIVLSAVGLLFFVLEPVITIKPSAFGIEKTDKVKLEYGIRDIRSGFLAVGGSLGEKFSQDEISKLESNLEKVINILPDSMVKEYRRAVKIVKWWTKFPIFFAVTVAVSIFGFTISAFFGTMGFIQKNRQRRFDSRGISIGGVIHLFSGVLLLIWGTKAFKDIFFILNDETLRKLIGVDEILENSISIAGSIVLTFVRCIGIGLIVPWICAIILIGVGIVAYKEEKKQKDYGMIVLPDIKRTKKREKRNGKILGIRGEYQNYEIEINNGESVLIGRSAQMSQIVLNSPYIGRCHCKITCQNVKLHKEYWINYEITNFSENGTFYSVPTRTGESVVNERVLIAKNETVVVEAGTEIWLANGENAFLLK